MDISVPIHKRSLNFFPIEMFKLVKGAALIFNFYGLWNRTDFAIQIFNFICNGVESSKYLGAKTREM